MRARVALYRDPNYNPAAAAAQQQQQQAAMADTGEHARAMAGWRSLPCGMHPGSASWRVHPPRAGSPRCGAPPALPAALLRLSACSGAWASPLCSARCCAPNQSGPPPCCARPAADEEEEDVPQVPLEELLEDLAALGLEGERGPAGRQRLLPRNGRAALRCTSPVTAGLGPGLSHAFLPACVPACRGRRRRGGRRRQRRHDGVRCRASQPEPSTPRAGPPAAVLLCFLLYPARPCTMLISPPPCCHLAAPSAAQIRFYLCCNVETRFTLWAHWQCSYAGAAQHNVPV